jgi:hypothetical protein
MLFFNLASNGRQIVNSEAAIMAAYTATTPHGPKTVAIAPLPGGEHMDTVIRGIGAAV